LPAKYEDAMDKVKKLKQQEKRLNAMRNKMEASLVDFDGTLKREKIRKNMIAHNFSNSFNHASDANGEGLPK
jgi:hypothetical protein